MYRRSPARALYGAAFALVIAGALLAATDAPWSRAATALRPAPPSEFGTPPQCAVTSVLTPSATTVRLGEALTVTTSFRAHCPQLLASRAVLIVVGAVPATAVQPVRDSMGAFVEAVAAADGSSAQLIRVDRNVQTPGWSSTDGELAALARDVRQLGESPARPADAWVTTMSAAERIVRELPPTKGPLLIVLDGSPLTDGSEAVDAAAAAAVVRAVQGTRDAAGRSVIFDVGDAMWLRQVFSTIGPSFEDHLLFVLTTTSSVEAAIRRALAAFYAPLTSWTGDLEDGTGHLLPIAADPISIPVTGAAILWQAPLTGYSAVITATGVFRAVGRPGRAEIVFLTRFDRQERRQERGPGLQVPICVQPAAPGPSVPCPETAAPPSSVPPAPPRRTATPPAKPTLAPDFEVRGRIWLPRVGRVGAGRSRP